MRLNQLEPKDYERWILSLDDKPQKMYIAVKLMSLDQVVAYADEAKADATFKALNRLYDGNFARKKAK